MNKITYFGDGQNKMFAFSFDFFQNDDICVEINGTRQTSGYKLTPIASTTPVDIPYVGGNITFDNAPSQADIVTIYRKIVTARNIDYQPTEKIDPETLNQDFNFLIEVIKDCRNAIDDFDVKYAEFTKLPEIQKLTQKLDMLGDITTIARTSDIGALQNATSFTATGKNTIANLATPVGDTIELNFIGTAAGTYTYTAEKSGILSLVFVPKTGGDFSILSHSGRTLWNETMTANIRRTILFPICQGKTITVNVPEISYISFQRLFPYQGAL